jgi:hypothetical protein
MMRILMVFFLIYICLSFLLGGLWIGTTTLLAERLGSRIGGIAAALPSTIVVSFLFIGMTQGLEFIAKAARAVPFGMAIDTIFLLIFVIGLKRNLWVAISASLASWFIIAFLSSQIPLLSWRLNLACYVIIVGIVLLIMDWHLRIRIVKGRQTQYSIFEILIRMGFAGIVVSGSLLAAKFFGLYWAGIFSTFPAVMLSTLVILSCSQEMMLASGTAKVLALSSTNIVIFAIAAHKLYPILGLFPGTIASYGASLVYLLLLWPVFSRFR